MRRIALHATSLAAALALAALAVGSADTADPATRATERRVPSRTQQGADAAERPGTPAYPSDASADRQAPAAPVWSYYKNTDAMTDRTVHGAGVQFASHAAFRDEGVLAVVCTGGGFAVVIESHESWTRTGYRSGSRPKATLRWDDGKPQQRTFDTTEGVSTSYMSRQPQTDARDLIEHDLLLVRYTRVLGGEAKLLEIDISGGADEIGKVAAACGVSL